MASTKTKPGEEPLDGKKIHPLTEQFPPMTAGESSAIAEDVKANGLAAAFQFLDRTPFPPSSDSAKVFAILLAHKDTGISMQGLVEFYMRCSFKDKPQADYEVGKVLSVGIKDGWIKIHDSLIILTSKEINQPPIVAPTEGESTPSEDKRMRTRR